jgi:hypothetical protein
MKLFAVACVFLVTMGSAHAQSAVQPTVQPTAPAPEPGDVSPTAALMFSLGGTLLSYGTIAAGFQAHSPAVVVAGATGAVIMPSVGRWYANSSGVGSLVIRAAGAGSVLAGVAIGFADCVVIFGENKNTCNSFEVTALVALGGMAFIGSTVYDIVRAPLDARDYNAARRSTQITLVPMIAPAQHDYGIALAGRF